MLPADVGLISSGMQVLDIENADSSYMSMPDSLWGAYNRDKWAVEAIIKRESILAGGDAIFYKSDGLAEGIEFSLAFDSDGKIVVRVYQSGSTTPQTNLVTTATYTSLTAWYHILFQFDYTNATANDRNKLYVNGTQVTVFDARTNATTATKTTISPVSIGATSGASNQMDAYIARVAFFSNSLPAFSDLVNTSTRIPKNILGVTGIYSLCSPLDGITYDRVRGQSWTNNGGVTVRAVAPVRIPA